jgi:exonuclease SbcC
VIKEIKINNFQSHKSTDIVLHPGLNVFVGTSGSGKTAITRALRWVADNKPQGDNFRSFWGGDTSVELVLDDISVTRFKSDKENSYSADKEIYKAFNKDVPEPIKKLINFNEINLQRQHDMPFLVSKSGPEIQRTLNEVANLDLIDTTMTNLNGMKIKNSTEINEKTEKLSEYEETIERLSGINKIRVSADGLIHMSDCVAEKKKDLAVISYTASLAESNISSINDSSYLLSKLRPISDISIKQDSLNSKVELLRSLSLCAAECLITQKEIHITKELLEKYTDLSSINDKFTKIKDRKKNLSEKKSALMGIIEIEDNLKTTSECISTSEKELLSVSKELKDLIGDRCPVCGKEIA